MIAVVIPTIRHLDQWLEAWKPQFDRPEVQLYVIEDRDEKMLKLPNGIKHYCRADIKNDLGENAWIISNFNSGIRSYGFLKAWQDGAKVIYTLDDDCYPLKGNELKVHLSNLDRTEDANWMSTLGEGYPRGFPYQIRKQGKFVLSHGLWEGNPDFDAPTELVAPKQLTGKNQVITRGAYFPMCIMNVAFRGELAPAMYQLLQGRDWEYDRFDDIWSGLIMKKIVDHLNWNVWSGTPHIKHVRMSNTFDNLIKEAKGIKRNEYFWEEVDSIQLTQNTFISCYQEFWEKFEPSEAYFIKLKEAALLWIRLFQ